MASPLRINSAHEYCSALSKCSGTRAKGLKRPLHALLLMTFLLALNEAKLCSFGLWMSEWPHDMDVYIALALALALEEKLPQRKRRNDVIYFDRWSLIRTTFLDLVEMHCFEIP